MSARLKAKSWVKEIGSHLQKTPEGFVDHPCLLVVCIFFTENVVGWYRDITQLPQQDHSICSRWGVKKSIKKIAAVLVIKELFNQSFEFDRKMSRKFCCLCSNYLLLMFQLSAAYVPTICCLCSNYMLLMFQVIALAVQLYDVYVFPD